MKPFNKTFLALNLNFLVPIVFNQRNLPEMQGKYFINPAKESISWKHVVRLLNKTEQKREKRIQTKMN